MKVFALLLLLAAAAAQFGCATTKEKYDDGIMDAPEPPSHDDMSHGWEAPAAPAINRQPDLHSVVVRS